MDVAQANVERNNCADIVTVGQFDLMEKLPDMGYDLVITNLYKSLLIRLFNDQGFWHPGTYMVSGFIPGMEPDLLAPCRLTGSRCCIGAMRSSGVYGCSNIRPGIRADRKSRKKD
ncbi:hypothetical protein VU01_11284 [Candidatus Electrothrix marina]|uniref:Ribosomal protein L11 methyltransferase (PrmA) n=1 Tax=Candidatus Electrothrix marina TaxID=1859130 RepID=A0A444JEH5_9BACT|nr:hypothetical protein VU01_11284 [Candidatus Electrothrix marina]